MDKKKILIVTYYWPPSGGSAVQRWLSFANILVEKGYEPIILTVKEEDATYPLRDETLLNQINPKIKVYKTATKELFWIYKKYIGKGKVPSAGFANEDKPNVIQQIARFIRGNFFIPDARKSWNHFAIIKAKEIIQSEGIATLITAGPPHSTHLIGKKLKSIFAKISWVADFHDAWTDVWYYDKLLKTSIARNIDASLEKEVLTKSDAVLTVGQYLKQVLISKVGKLPPEKFHILSMGYDIDLEKLPKNNPKEAFTITYTGTIDTEYYPHILFEVIKDLLSNRPNWEIKLRFVGLLAPELKTFITQLGLLPLLEETGYVSHKKSIEYLNNSSVLLLVSPKTKSEKIIIPGKLYEYLAIRKPILNIGNLETDTARIVSDCEAGYNIDRTEHEKLRNILTDLYLAWQKNPDLDITHANLSYKQYARTQETQRLIDVIESLK